MFRLLLVGAIVFAVYWFGFRGGCGTSGSIKCPDPALESGVGSAISAADICPDAGYLCNEKGTFQVARWPLDKGKLRVRVPLPDFVDKDVARELREVVIEGIKAWDRHPFPIVIDTGKVPLKGWDIGVVWSEGLYNEAAGLARVGYKIDGKRVDFMNDGLAVVVPPLNMSIPGFGVVPGLPALMDNDTRMEIVRAVATHEMGHALGLMHSNNPDDIMYPSLRQGAKQVRASSRDFRTIDTLYTLPNGALLQ